MQHNSNKFSIEDAMRIAKSPAGQQLISILQKSNAEDLKEAMSHASGGNMEQAKEKLAPLLSSPEIQSLLKQLGGK